jgi:hypothetical protein
MEVLPPQTDPAENIFSAGPAFVSQADFCELEVYASLEL